MALNTMSVMCGISENVGDVANAFSVGPSSWLMFPGLLQPWALIRERLRRCSVWTKRYQTLMTSMRLSQRFQRWSLFLVDVPRVVATLGFKLANAFGVVRFGREATRG